MAVEGAPPARLHVVEPGKVVEVLPLPAGAQAEVTFTRRSEGRPGWLRVELRDLEGVLLALSNPIYLNAPAAPAP